MTIVMLAGSPVSMKPWADRAKAIVWMSYSGMEGGTALAEVLFGAVNPSGNLQKRFRKRFRNVSGKKRISREDL